MLPNLNIPPLKIYGPIEIHAFGVLVAAAVIIGFELGRKRAIKMGLDHRISMDGMIWAVIGGFALAHWVSAVFYFPEKIAENPLYLVRFWDGISSFGGFLGGLIGSYLYFRHKKVVFLDYAETVLFGLVPGWVVGRLGCTIAFDHPGLPTDFVLGMMDEHGVVRHNLGFYEFLAAGVLCALLYSLKNVRPFKGFHHALMMALYAPVRFCWDFLRISDKTYLGLTPAQYLAILMLLFAVGWMVVGLRHKTPKALAES